METAAAAASPRLLRLYRRVGAQIDELTARCGGPEEALALQRPEVSGWAVGQHLEHLGITGAQIVGAVEKALEKEPGGGPGVWGYLVFSTGRIPRGRVKARPEWTPADVDASRARASVAALAERFLAVEPLLPAIERGRGSVRHPILGPLTSRRWLRFLEIHQHHHLAIVRDVEGAAGGRRAAS